MASRLPPASRERIPAYVIASTHPRSPGVQKWRTYPRASPYYTKGDQDAHGSEVRHELTGAGRFLLFLVGPRCSLRRWTYRDQILTDAWLEHATTTGLALYIDAESYAAGDPATRRLPAGNSVLAASRRPLMRASMSRTPAAALPQQPKQSRFAFSLAGKIPINRRAAIGWWSPPTTPPGNSQWHVDVIRRHSPSSIKGLCCPTVPLFRLCIDCMKARRDVPAPSDLAGKRIATRPRAEGW